MLSSLLVLPTDTLYGIVGSALDKRAVEKIYRLRRRNKKKPMIILIVSIKSLSLFGIYIEGGQKKALNKLWPGRVSVILPCRSKKFSYLHRGTNSLAFRVPDSAWLRNFLKETGPLVAPSANIEGEPPAKNIAQAQRYFGDKVDVYISGRVSGKPSTVVSMDKKGKLTLVRQGAVRVVAL